MTRTIKLIYKDLSYRIVGVLFKVYKELGAGHREKFYQKAISLELAREKLSFKEQLKVDLMFGGVTIGKYFLDFEVANKVILEIKSGNDLNKKNIDQVYSYLRAHNLKLGIIANFTRRGVKCKRIVNLY